MDAKSATCIIVAVAAPQLFGMEAMSDLGAGEAQQHKARKSIMFTNYSAWYCKYVSGSAQTALEGAGNAVSGCGPRAENISLSDRNRKTLENTLTPR